MIFLVLTFPLLYPSCVPRQLVPAPIPGWDRHDVAPPVFFRLCCNNSATTLLMWHLQGALLVVLGVTLAAVNAYSLSRGVGRRLAERIIAAEVGETGGGGAGGHGGPVAQQLAAVNRAIEQGGFMRQAAAVALLRLTPVVPFSASNYLLGLTPVQLGPLVLGTLAGMSVWSVLYASLGGASRVLLQSGADLGELMDGAAPTPGPDAFC